MELGEKLRQARLDAGLSQRQLCGEEITRNMLSQIEHGTAAPSMSTLRYLAGRLGMPVSFFLEEETVTSPNQKIMEDISEAFQAGDYATAAAHLKRYQQPDPVYDREMELLKALIRLEAAEQALNTGKRQQARELLEIPIESGYMTRELERRRLLLLGSLPGQKLEEICRTLPSLDPELILRAKNAMKDGNLPHALHLLDAAEDHGDSQWNLLYGECIMQQGRFSDAIAYLQIAEKEYPLRAASAMERCYREVQDFQNAYLYACKIRDIQ